MSYELRDPEARREMLSTFIEKTERSLRLVGVVRLRLGERYNKSSIINIQFPDKSGFTLRYNPASGISATLRPAKLVRLGLT